VYVVAFHPLLGQKWSVSVMPSTQRVGRSGTMVPSGRRVKIGCHAAALCGAARFLALMIASTSGVVISLIGLSVHAGMKRERRSCSARLPRRSDANFVGDEGFRDVGE
jgi:hypothetical protein